MLAAAERDTGVRRAPVPGGDPLLDGGDAVYDPQTRRIWYRADVDSALAAMYQAHEYAHVWLGHADGAHCNERDLDSEEPDERVPLGVHLVQGYGPKERRERDANVFAREFLLPTDLLRSWFTDEGMSASAIAARLGVPVGVVHHQLAYAVFLGDLPHGEPPSAREAEAAAERNRAAAPAAGSQPPLDSLDPSQRDAARAPHGPVLVEAGPGTGKTRTLVARILHLLGSGVDARSILALTFSNKAAEEMRDRVARAAPEAAPLIWMGTFHAFGLELLRKYGTRIGLPADPRMLDPVEAMFLLEQNLTALQLQHYQYLPEPTRDLKPILAAISRAKDELATPAAYREAATRWRARAQADDEKLAAEKALEVARVYEVYQSLLERDGALDFGDLIARAVTLLDGDVGVRDAVRDAHRHVLVDEYQDVNRASAVLLKALAGAGAGLWVVGDARQSIYRFRGAAPVNMARFAEDFPGARVLRLARNYRSQPDVVRAVSKFAAEMPALPGAPFVAWDADRPDAGGGVRMELAPDADAEGAGVAREVAHHRDRGVAFRDQAVLCRSHTGLARIGAHLEAAGIPVLYLGDLFERPEVRDMLALLSLACHGDGRGLVRVARFAEYAIPLADVSATLAIASERDWAFPEALGRVASLSLADSRLSEEGRSGLSTLAGHLDAISRGSEAWTMLSLYLLERSSYARRTLGDPTLAGRQRRFAVYQLIQFAYEHRRRARVPSADQTRQEDPKRSFLRMVRRMAMLGDDTQLRQLPEWATSIDAVRLLTIHASKGLEFPVVFVPGLAAGRFPVNFRGARCPLPQELAGPDRDERMEHDREEECLFFVAISRAQDVLHLSRALTYTKNGNRSNPSKLLARLEAARSAAQAAVTWPAGPTARTVEYPAIAVGDPATSFDAKSLAVYSWCPRRYFYAEVLHLHGSRDESAYLEMHRCVYRVLRWLGAESARGAVIDLSGALAQLDEAWRSGGPREHPYEPLYRAAAETIVGKAVAAATRRADRPVLVQPEWTLPLAHGSITVVPDEVDVSRESGRTALVVRRIRTGRPSTTESEDPVYSLYRVAADHAFPGSATSVEIVYVAADESRIVDRTAKQIAGHVAKYDDAMQAIARGDFPPTPSEHDCPRCPYFFICPAAGEQ